MKIDRFEGEYRFLSNFYCVNIEYEGIMYPSTEHAYQAAKTLDLDTRKTISKLRTPGLSKRAGRGLTLRTDWDDVKEQVMYDLLKLKFSIPILNRKLTETRDQELIEGNNWHDCYWGVCYCAKCNGVGQNRLGKLLMKLRTEF